MGYIYMESKSCWYRTNSDAPEASNTEFIYVAPTLLIARQLLKGPELGIFGIF